MESIRNRSRSVNSPISRVPMSATWAVIRIVVLGTVQELSTAVDAPTLKIH